MRIRMDRKYSKNMKRALLQKKRRVGSWIPYYEPVWSWCKLLVGLGGNLLVADPGCAAILRRMRRRPSFLSTSDHSFLTRFSLLDLPLNRKMRPHCLSLNLPWMETADQFHEISIDLMQSIILVDSLQHIPSKILSWLVSHWKSTIGHQWFLPCIKIFLPKSLPASA